MTYVWKVVDNVSVEVKDLHVRYEDKVAAPMPFAVGVTLDTIKAYTCNASGDKTYVKDFQKTNTKMANLKNLTAYLEVGDKIKLLSTKTDAEELSTCMEELVCCHIDTNTDFRFLAEPPHPTTL